MILKTKRLLLRELTPDDYGDLCRILQDGEVMYAYEHAFSEEEAREWLDRQLGRYAAHGFGLWAVVLKECGALIGQCGVTLQDWEGREVHEVGYLFQRAYWHMGYAAEAAMACRDWAFEKLGVEEVFSIIRDNNRPSRRVAERNGMTERGSFVKHYHGVDMPHVVYSVRRG